MKRILVIGAGRSSANLIKYLIDHAGSEDWHIRIGDMDLASAIARSEGSKYASAFAMQASDVENRRLEIQQADLVISMLPASMHVEIAKDCLAAGKNVITPSYVSDEMWLLDQEARNKGLLFLNEMGVDPGIDHMSAMKIIDDIKSRGGTIESFESFTGGLIAPESDDNPWNYKITWNPRNVVLAGYGGTAQYLMGGQLKFIPYHRLFERITPVAIEGYGRFDGYANRDSLKYAKHYGLEKIPTLYRGTLRREGFCKAWNVLVQLGFTDDSVKIHNASGMTWRSLTSSFLNITDTSEAEDELVKYLDVDPISLAKLKWLGIFGDEPIGLNSMTPAEALQKLIENKWKLGEDDKDMIVMWHRFRYHHEGSARELQSSLITTGDDQVHTAMSKTVGLPIAIAARMILDGRIALTGVRLPVVPEIYNPVLDELKSYGITFKETETSLA